MDGNDGADSVYRAAALRQPATGSGDAASLAAARLHPAAVDLLAGPVGRRREHPRQVVAALRRRARRLRPPHGQRQQLHARPRCRRCCASIYAYHVKSRGWSDIGYNYLVDRFGRIWEGRYGGVDRAVVGAHTLGYNDVSFATSAIGNYEIAQPPPGDDPRLRHAVRLEAVPARHRRRLDAPVGHQAAGSRRSTATATRPRPLCPGQYLYAKIPEIRAPGRGRPAGLDAAGSWSPNLALDADTRPRRTPSQRRRGASSSRPAGSMPLPGRRPTVATGRSRRHARALAGHRRRHRRRAATTCSSAQADGSVTVRPGNGYGHASGRGRGRSRRFRGADQLVAPGDLERRRPQRPGRAQPRHRRLSCVPAARPARRVPPARRSVAIWGSYDLVAGRRRPERRRPPRPGRPRPATAGCGCTPARGNGDVRRPGAGPRPLRRGTTSWPGARRPHRRRPRRPVGAQRSRPAPPTSCPARATAPFGRRARPVHRLRRRSAPGASATSPARRRPTSSALDAGHASWSCANPGSSTSARRSTPLRTSPRADKILDVGDWDRDGHGDVITRARPARQPRALARQRARASSRSRRCWAPASARCSRLAAVGDMTGDGYPDLMGAAAAGRDDGSTRATGWPGFKAAYPAYGASSRRPAARSGSGCWNADGAPTACSAAAGRSRLYQGNGPGGLHSPARLSGRPLAVRLGDRGQRPRS